MASGYSGGRTPRAVRWPTTRGVHSRTVWRVGTRASLGALRSLWAEGGLSWRWDLAPAAVLGAIGVVGTHFVGMRHAQQTTTGVWALVLVVVGAVALVFRRQHPATTLGVVFAATLTSSLIDYPKGPMFLLLIVAFFTAATHGYRRSAWAAIAAGFVSFPYSATCSAVDRRPARIALTAIKAASKDALGELRSVLGVLRQADEEASRTPTPGLGRLDDLLAQVGAAGLRVTSLVDGQPRSLPTGVDLAAFRIVQEALTNVARHAGPATATITVGYAEHALTLTVDDDGRGPTLNHTAGSGNGIPGMAERAASLGGHLDAGARPGGGFRVMVRLPLTEQR